MRWDWPKQTLLTEDGKIGDCWRCCVAAVLQIPAEDVPHFLEESKSRSESMDHLTQMWLNERGYWLIWSPHDSIQTPYWSNDRLPPPVISCGPTVRSRKQGQHHAVVTVGGRLVYDPHPWQCGLLYVSETYLIVPFFRTEGVSNG